MEPRRGIRSCSCFNVSCESRERSIWFNTFATFINFIVTDVNVTLVYERPFHPGTVVTGILLTKSILLNASTTVNTAVRTCGSVDQMPTPGEEVTTQGRTVATERGTTTTDGGTITTERGTITTDGGTITTEGETMSVTVTQGESSTTEKSITPVSKNVSKYYS